MRRLILKEKDKLWPTVIWQNSNLLVYYLGEEADDVKVRESSEIDFEEFFLHLDRGGSIFVTMRQRDLPPDATVNEAMHHAVEMEQ